jgi:hypothetical protein
MNIRHLRFSALVAIAVYLLCACASIAQSDGEKRAAEVKIFGLGDPNTSRYEVVSRPWVDSWRSALWVPTYPSEEQALAALQTEAARRGADGLMNVSCLNQGRPNAEPAILCYGIGIRLRPSNG